MMVVAAKARKKLIEISIPLEAINKEALRRKQKAPKGYPTAIHKYWAQRPIALCRAILFAQLVDDPDACADEFPTLEERRAERDRLHRLIERLILWENSRNEDILNEARYEIIRSLARARGDTLPSFKDMRPQQIIEYLQQHAPPICDPFSGAGSILLEAQRLGLNVEGSDLNPVAVLIGKTLVEFPPKFEGRKPVNPGVNELHQWEGARGLADDVRYYSRRVREQAEERIGNLYPKVKLKDGRPEGTVAAWLWARTVPSPDPRAKGAHVPLSSTFLLSSKAGKEVIVKPVVDRAEMTWTFQVDDEPSKADIETAKLGTKMAGGFRCLLTGTPLKFEQLREYGKASRFGARLMAIVVDSSGRRTYLSPVAEHETLALNIRSDWRPDQPMDGRALGFRVPEYGLTTWGDIFTERQLVALSTFSDLVIEARKQILADAELHWSGDYTDDGRRLAEGGQGPAAYADAVTTYLALVLDRMAYHGSALCGWLNKDNAMGKTMPKQALSMSWDYAEGNPFGTSSSDFTTCSRAISDCLDASYARFSSSVTLRDAQTNTYERGTAFSTDPPYYDNVGFADLSDFFYVWLRRTLSEVHPDLFRLVLVPKNEELVATPNRQGGKEEAESHFMEGMKNALRRFVDAIDETPAAIYYAYKQHEAEDDALTSAGWSSFLQALVDAGLAVDGTWPVRSESEGRSRALSSNALASSIVLVCRRRISSAPTLTRSDFLRVLRREMPSALAEIRRSRVGPTDIHQAAIGPGIGIFTRYAQVLNNDGTPMPVRDALKLINQVREEITSFGDADYDSETRFALDWFAAKGFEKGRSGDAITMTNAVDVSLDGMNSAGFFLAEGGIARLLKREELQDSWDPARDNSATVWEACQHLIKCLRAEDGGIDAAAELYNKLGALADPVHALARRLYDICDQKQWASEGRVYNQLHQEWDVIEKRAAELAEIGSRRDLFSN